MNLGGQTIGTFSGGVGVNPLEISLTAQATQAATQVLLRNIAYRNVSDNPTTAKRTVSFVLQDGDGGTSTAVTSFVNVQAVNDAPVISAPAARAYVENAVPVLLAPGPNFGSVSDPDSPNFATGKLTATITANYSSSDRLSIRNQGVAAGQIGISGANVRYGGVIIGQYNAIGNQLTVSLNANSSVAATQALLRNLTFETLGDNPSGLQRTVQLVLTDGDGGTSATSSIALNVTPVNDRPAINGFGGNITFVEDGQNISIAAPSTTVTDPDSNNFDGGVLTVRFSVNGQREDRLTIRNNGAISFNENGDVFFNNVAIGTYSGGHGTSALVVNLNSQSNGNKVAALLRNIAYRATSQNPSPLPRTLTARLTDGDGGTSLLVQKTLNVVPVVDHPLLANISGTVGYSLNSNAAAIVSQQALVFDVDSPDFDTGKLTVRITSGSDVGNRLALGGTVFSIVNNKLLRSGVEIGSLNNNAGRGLTKFEVTFNELANRDYVRQLIRALRFRTENSSSLATREISFTLTDGDGGTSNTLTKLVNVS